MFSDMLLSIDTGTYLLIQSSTEETEIIDTDPLSRITPRDQATSRIPRDHVTSRSRAPSYLITPLFYGNLPHINFFFFLYWPVSTQSSFKHDSNCLPDISQLAFKGHCP